MLPFAAPNGRQADTVADPLSAQIRAAVFGCAEVRWGLRVLKRWASQAHGRGLSGGVADGLSGAHGPSFGPGALDGFLASTPGSAWNASSTSPGRRHRRNARAVARPERGGPPARWAEVTGPATLTDSGGRSATGLPGAGIVAASDRTWQAAGPALPAPLHHQVTTVLRLTPTSHRMVALLETGTGPDPSLPAALVRRGRRRLDHAPQVRLHGAKAGLGVLRTNHHNLPARKKVGRQ